MESILSTLIETAMFIAWINKEIKHNIAYKFTRGLIRRSTN